MSKSVQDSMGTLAKGTALNLVGKGFDTTSRLVFNLMLARMLGPQQLGIYFVALTVASILGVSATAGFDATLVRYLARYRTDHNWAAFRGTLRFAVSSVLLLGTALTLGLELLAPWLANAVFHKPEVTVPLRIIALYIPVFALETILLAAVESFKTMRYTLYIESILNPATRILLVAAIWMLGGGVRSVLTAYVFTILLCSTMAYAALRKSTSPEMATYQPYIERAELIAYSLPLLGITILTFSIRYLDTLFLAHYRSAAEVGLYSVSLRVTMITGFSLTVVSKIFAPIISELHHKGQMDELGAYLKVVTLWAVQIFTPLLLLFCIAPQKILGVFGNEFRAAAVCLVILIIGQMANIVTGPVGLVLNMAGWTRLQLWNSIAVLAIQITLCILLIPRWGILGAAVANGAAVILVNAARVVQVQAKLHINPFGWLLLKPVAAAATALLAAVPLWGNHAALGNVRSAMLFAAMLLVYFGMLLVMGPDHHSRVAGLQLWGSVRRKLAPTPLGFYLRKEIQ